MKNLLFILNLFISVCAFAQEKHLRLNVEGHPDGKNIFFEFNSPKPQRDTVDVIVLVSDTTIAVSDTPIKHDRLWIYDGWEWHYPTIAIKCKAIREKYYYDEISEYLLPKKYIVWQSKIISK